MVGTLGQMGDLSRLSMSDTRDWTLGLVMEMACIYWALQINFSVLVPENTGLSSTIVHELTVGKTCLHQIVAFTTGPHDKPPI